MSWRKNAYHIQILIPKIIFKWSKYYYPLHFIQAIISTRRLSRFLSCSERKTEPSDLIGEEGMDVLMSDASCAWSNSDEEQPNPVLDHVTLNLPRGSFIAVIGEVMSSHFLILFKLLQ